MSTPISIQLFSVRDGMEKDFEGTLKAVSELGYSAVEFAGFFGHTAEQVNELLDKYGLKASGTHSPLDDLLNNYDATVAFHKAIGNRNYIIPGIDLSCQERIDYFVGKVNPLSERLAADGIKLGFHNHSSEFRVNRDGSVPYEQLLYRTELMLELDTYWAFVGMGDPIAMMDRIGDRLAFVHVKDGDANGAGQPLGMGEAPVKAVYDKAVALGIPMVVESETCKPDGLTEAKICIEYLRSLEK